MNDKATFLQNLHPSSQVVPEISNFKDDPSQKNRKKTSQSAVITLLKFCEKFNSSMFCEKFNSTECIYLETDVKSECIYLLIVSVLVTSD